MTGYYGNQASILNIRGILAVEEVVTQLDHIRLQGEGKRGGEGGEERGRGNGGGGRGSMEGGGEGGWRGDNYGIEVPGQRRAYHTNTHSSLTISVINFTTHTHTLDASCLVHGSHQLEDTGGHCRGGGKPIFILEQGGRWEK